jgi:hypothetical protein
VDEIFSFVEVVIDSALDLESVPCIFGKDALVKSVILIEFGTEVFNLEK